MSFLLTTVDVIVNHLPSALATRAHILRPAKAKGTNPACLYTCCSQAGEKEHKQRDFYLKKKEDMVISLGKHHTHYT